MVIVIKVELDTISPSEANVTRAILADIVETALELSTTQSLVRSGLENEAVTGWYPPMDADGNEL
jgi:hypothetical protein